MCVPFESVQAAHTATNIATVTKYDNVIVLSLSLSDSVNHDECAARRRWGRRKLITVRARVAG